MKAQKLLIEELAVRLASRQVSVVKDSNFAILNYSFERIAKRMQEEQTNMLAADRELINASTTTRAATVRKASQHAERRWAFHEAIVAITDAPICAPGIAAAHTAAIDDIATELRQFVHRIRALVAAELQAQPKKKKSTKLRICAAAKRTTTK